MSYALKLPEPAAEPATLEEYLAREKDAEHKSEFFGDRIVAMAGASPAHNTLASNFLIETGRQLLETECQSYNSDQKVRVFDAGRIFYPDASVVCEDAHFDDDGSLRNPLVVVEVLSDSTEHKDRVEKWLHYQQLASLRAYILIAQDQILVEVFERPNPETDWTYRSFSRKDDHFPLHCLGITLSVAALYRRVPAPEPPDPRAG
ncbi:Uma2 family endonuclease [Armatimonas rosea]|uniref:Uma2 family endonuclease n=1 Tax=Armatimonas rosea TaxID=685828 RepID=A0A7W9W763_ARMRO|nr:Uma2 family endonuclease [Armatimonas rosea]MBB6051318.1 Uma2 family endonuclease [Armatimonas rosea]